ncbi:IS1182 family transposase [Listeria monocytogenes]|uniref:IS1182 family transposase n=1 Tax=Listeria monocytogenes TaxID=1639 RepID=UPI0010B9FA27|nr:IS1182 family transposase [Listeria monocytogenes]EAC2340938.1 IS1182 family transposase [Listeria monocytogenes]EAC2676667.1 IS1182 family transposase [Listeria monocytogenes]EAC8669814.1 IS1182 family transposase [Listeria monocytogenes]EAC8916717.1 IS1182 family transposase [Listeria monocytogenes]EAC9092859.1 IS1182 family transposase [Listeria monocytogenes]
MMTRRTIDSRNCFEIVSIEDLVPKDHLVRKVDKALNFDFIYPLVESMYSSQGRPSIDPVILFKMVFIQYLFGIRSMRQTIKEIEANMAYRWFLGLEISEKVPHFSTFGKNYIRRFKDTDVFYQIFFHILNEAHDKGFIDDEVIFIDSTHIKANANKHSGERVLVEQEVKFYQTKLEEEINEVRVAAGKKPFDFSEEREPSLKNISTTDSESGYFVKGEKERQFAYSAHTACDKNGFILGMQVTPGNIHDSQILPSLVDGLKSLPFYHPYGIAADAGYKTPAIAKYLDEEGLRPILPYTRPRGKKGSFRKPDFVYDEYYDQYLCPAGETLRAGTLNREGYRNYLSDKKKCANCPMLEKCTESQGHQKIIQRHLWQPYLDKTEELRYTKYNKMQYSKRKETVERIFADGKEKHGLRWTKLRGLIKNQHYVMLVFAMMNLKKIATWIW